MGGARRTHQEKIVVWRIDDPQGNEAAKVKYDIVPYTRGRGLDLGCGTAKAFPHFIGVDNCKDNVLFGHHIVPNLRIEDCAELSMFNDGSMDFVFSSHLLEHIENTWAALHEWWRVVKPGGYLVLYLPHKNFYPNIGEPGANPDHKHDFLPPDIVNHMCSIGGFDLVVNEPRNEGNEYSFLQIYQKPDNKDQSNRYSYRNPRPDKTACVVRYGGYGDMLQASNILPELKRQGYHITFMTTPQGQNIVRHNPYIDDWFIQDTDQVPNHELPEFWKVQAKRFDKFINLSESVEGTYLAMPGRANHAWPFSVREKRLDVNYLEFTADLAEVAYRSESHFYPSPEEAAWSINYVRNIRMTAAQPGLLLEPRLFIILWALAGSSVHKFYPHMDQVIARIMLEMPDVRLILNGDEACQILECGWEAEPRITLTAGRMSIRESLALAQQVNCVVGPETGILNAVAFESMGKVILLSHSSKENLTKHWVNTITIEPEGTPCYPCHRLHYTREFCPEHEPSGAAMCQYNIDPERVLKAIKQHYHAWHSRVNLLSGARGYEASC
jgi:ADP-heptose:LPS heptosyltransferase/predicted SAM-dependent methyltransferase